MLFTLWVIIVELLNEMLYFLKRETIFVIYYNICMEIIVGGRKGGSL